MVVTAHTADELRARLRELKNDRTRQHVESRPARVRRMRLTAKERSAVFAKTAGRCHICGGSVAGEAWQADHVLAHSAGGVHSADNYLPAHSLCNNYRWDYLQRRGVSLGVKDRRMGANPDGATQILERVAAAIRGL